MLLGTPPGGAISPSSHQQSRGYKSQLAAGGCGGTEFCILSKSSISFDQSDQSLDSGSLLDFFGSGSAARSRHQNSSSFNGEPATPDGHGDTVIGSARPRHNFVSGNASLAPLGEHASEGHNFKRRSCNLSSETTSHGHGASEVRSSAPILGSLLLGSAEPSRPLLVPGSAQAAGGWTAGSFVDPFIVQAADADARARSLEKQLREKCAENRALAQQLQDREAELTAARAEIERLRLSGLNSAAHLPTHLHAGLLTQLERAKTKLPSRTSQSAGGSSEQERPLPAASVPPTSSAGYHYSVMATAPGTPVPPTPALLQSAAPGQPYAIMPELELFRLDTPQCADSLSRLISDAARLSQHSAASVASSAEPTIGLEDSPDSNRESAMVCSSPPPPQAQRQAQPACLTQVTAAPAQTAPLPPLPELLYVERRRTDRAHAALLVISRQAHGLSRELAAVRRRAAELHEELRDWRQACLDNHKQVVQLRRAMAAVAAAAASAGPRQGP